MGAVAGSGRRDGSAAEAVGECDAQVLACENVCSMQSLVLMGSRDEAAARCAEGCLEQDEAASGVDGVEHMAGECMQRAGTG